MNSKFSHRNQTIITHLNCLPDFHPGHPPQSCWLGCAVAGLGVAPLGGPYESWWRCSSPPPLKTHLSRPQWVIVQICERVCCRWRRKRGFHQRRQDWAVVADSVGVFLDGGADWPDKGVWEQDTAGGSFFHCRDVEEKLGWVEPGGSLGISVPPRGLFDEA